MSPANNPFQMTIHARTRSQQRGVPIQTVEAIISYADIRRWVGAGCRSLMISRRRLASLSPGTLSPAQCEQAKGIVVVLHEADRAVVTVLHTDGRRGARYRRSFATRSGRSSVPAVNDPSPLAA